MTAVRALLFSAWVATSLLASAARAHEGHDDAASPMPMAPGGGIPRVEAYSDLFEIVGVVNNGVMTLFLDRYATNDPITNAKIDIELGAAKGSAQPNPDGTYTFKHAALSQPAQLPVTFAIAVGSDADLLTAELVIVDPNAGSAHSTATPLWKSWWWAAGGLLLLGMISVAWLLRRRQLGRESAK